MPELPEVETLVRQLRPLLVGRTIIAAKLSHDDILDGVTRQGLLRGLKGARITSVDRRAKHALIRAGKKTLAVQPGMSGTLLHYRREPPAEAMQYAVLRCSLDDGSMLIYRDVRRIGTIRWLDDTAWEAYSSRLGPEPLDPSLTPAMFADLLGRSTSAIKKVLMNQAVIVGVGNIYANEALFAAGIRPSVPARRISRRRLMVLFEHVQRVLTQAIASEGSTIRSYVSSSGSEGRFQRTLRVYGRGGEPCTVCGTTLRSTHTIDKRATVYCTKCQK